MHPLDLRFQKLLVKQIDERHSELAMQLTEGSCTDIAEYKERCGYLRALRDVVVWADEIKKSLDESA